MNIFAWRGRRKADKTMARNLYEALLAQARQPVFYTDGQVPDTPDGRFDMIALHAFMVMRAAPLMTRYVRQCLFDIMFREMERACREMGFGDLSVPRYVKNMMTGFKGRYYAYDTALDTALADDAALIDALRRNVYRKGEAADDVVAALAAYVRGSCAIIAQLPPERVRAGELEFARWEDVHGNRQQAA